MLAFLDDPPPLVSKQIEIKWVILNLALADAVVEW